MILKGDRRHRSGGAVLAQARPDRQGVDRVEHALRGLQAKLRTLFRRPELRLGLAAVRGRSRARAERRDRATSTPCIFADSAHHKTSEFAGSLYERAVVAGSADHHRRPRRRGPTARRSRTTLITERGAQLHLAPLHYQDKVIGTLELVSPRPGDLNATHLPKLEEVLPLFSMAVQRSVEELNARIQAVHQGEVHGDPPGGRVALPQGRAQRHRAARPRAPPTRSPRWSRSCSRGSTRSTALADIRGSSTQRSLAIQADLLDPAPARRAT